MVPTSERVVSLVPCAGSKGPTQSIPALLAAMDAEHREVLESVAALAVVPPTRFASAYAALVAQIEAGFREEEQMMDQIGYGEIRAHRRDHAELLALLHRLRPYLDDGNAPLADIVMGMIPAMLVRHMAGMDQALALALRMQGAGSGQR